MTKVWRCACLLLAILVYLVSPAAVRAGTSGSFYLPLGVPQQTFAGLMLKVDTDWAQGYGYRPVRLELIATRPANEERSLTVEVSLNDFSNRSVVASTAVTLPAGSRNVVQWIAVPQLANDQTLTVRTYARGRLIEELSTERFSIGSGQYWAADSGIPRALFVADAPPDISGFKFLGSQPYMTYGNVTFGRPQDVGFFTHLPEADLFDESIYYSALDMIFMSRTEAAKLATGKPRVWQAISSWVRSGGTLILYGVNHEDTQLGEVEQLVNSTATPGEAAQPHRGWSSPDAKVYYEKVLMWSEMAKAHAEAEALANGVPLSVEPSGDGTSTPDEATPDEAADGKKDDNESTDKASDGKTEAPADRDGEAGREVPFLWRPVGMGFVVAWRDPKPFPGDELDWRWLMTSLPQTSTQWTLRRGTSPDQENPQFNELLIADVGLPPIQTYKVLITFFVVLIGPVNYWLLRRYERLHLFLFTVPLAALIVTGGLLAYAIMSDGLESRLRARSLTMLDQQAGQAASSAWLSYYAGYTPRAGLTFPRETVVVPLELEPAYYLTGQSRRQIAWDAQQRLTRGWLPARTPIQLVTNRAYPSSQSLVFATPAADGSRRVTNNLGVRVHALLVSDEDGELLAARDLEAGEQGSLASPATEDEKREATLAFLKVFDQHAPAVPDGMNLYDGRNPWQWFRMGPVYSGQHQVTSDKSGLEAHLAELRMKVSSGDLEPRRYVAVVDRPEQVSAGMDNLTESQSTHVILGSW